jgi:uroporphyrinogen decarboxylase
VRDVLARAGGRPGHIFNLGHGVLPGTDPGVLGRVRELVHAETANAAANDRWTKSPTTGTPA